MAIGFLHNRKGITKLIGDADLVEGGDLWQK